MRLLVFMGGWGFGSVSGRAAIAGIVVDITLRLGRSTDGLFHRHWRER